MTEHTPIEPYQALREKAREVATAKKALEISQESLDRLMTRVYATKAYRNLRGEVNRLEQDVGKKDTELRRLLADIYEELGEKSPLSGLGVRIYDQFSIEDKRAALEWCEANLPMAIEKTINIKLVKSALKVIDPEDRPEWANFGTKITPTVSKDLSAYLEEPETEEVPF